jgi:glycosyltransferase involved in cell wall biosynthesis
MKVSVALATYNGAKYLRPQLMSLAEQTHLPMELVIADDGSTDDTLEVIEAFKASAPFDVRVVATDGGAGPSKNFERAMLASQGDLVFCCDQDDFWHPDKIARMVAAFSPVTTLAFCDANLVDQDMRPLGTTLWKRIKFERSEFSLIEHLGKHTIAFGLTMAYRNDKPIRDLLFPIPMPFGHDNFTALLAASVGEVAIVDTPLVDYRQHAQQVSGTRGKKSAMQVSITPTAASFEALAERIPFEALSKNGALLHGFCKAKAQHLHLRESLSKKDVKSRVLGVIGIARTHDYSKYSNGLRSAVRDLLGDL